MILLPRVVAREQHHGRRHHHRDRRWMHLSMRPPPGEGGAGVSGAGGVVHMRGGLRLGGTLQRGM